MTGIRIWTDGSCLGNPGPGGWAALIDKGSDKMEFRNGGHPNTTNNEMELTAVADALRNLGGRHRVTVYTDSMYVVNGMSAWIYDWADNDWKKSSGREVKNRYIWEEIWYLMDQHNIRVVHVPRNSTSEMLLVDGLARGNAAKWEKANE